MEQLFDPIRREMAVEYHRKRKHYQWIERIASLILFVLFFGLELEVKLFSWLTGWVNGGTGKFLVYLTGFFLAAWVLGILPEYFFGYRLEREYQLSTQTAGAWLLDQFKYLLLTLGFIYLTGGAFLYLVRVYPTGWWLAYSLGGFVFYLLIAFLLPVVFLPMFFKLTPYPDTPLRQRLEELFHRAKVQVQNIYEINLSSRTNSANAAVIGLGKTRKIILGDTLRDRYTDAEIEAVMAHEIGHHVHKDIFMMLWISLGGILITSFVTAQVWPWVVNWRGYGELDAICGLPALFTLVGACYWLISPLQQWISRWMERRADAFSLRLIENPRDLATAFAKLADDGLALLRLDLYTLIFKASHPPIGERIEMALGWRKRKYNI